MTSTPAGHHPPSLDAASWGFAEDFVPLPEHISASRDEAISWGVEAITPGTVTALTLMARLVGARTVVEIGTGTGTSGLALFAGMTDDGILTSIDPAGDRQQAARAAFGAAGLPSNRFRLISGVPLEVLPKLRDGAYDMVFINGDRLEYVEYIAQALRLLRHGGLVLVNEALWHGLVADEDNEDDETVIIREALQSVSDTEEFTSALLPVGGGILAAIKD